MPIYVVHAVLAFQRQGRMSRNSTRLHIDCLPPHTHTHCCQERTEGKKVAANEAEQTKEKPYASPWYEWHTGQHTHWPFDSGAIFESAKTVHEHLKKNHTLEGHCEWSEEYALYTHKSYDVGTLWYIFHQIVKVIGKYPDLAYWVPMVLINSYLM